MNNTQRQVISHTFNNLHCNSNSLALWNIDETKGYGGAELFTCKNVNHENSNIGENHLCAQISRLLSQIK